MTYDLVGHFDGSCWPNPGGEARWGYVLKTGADEVVAVDQGVIPAGKTSNNVAEYKAVAMLLDAIFEMDARGNGGDRPPYSGKAV